MTSWPYDSVCQNDSAILELDDNTLTVIARELVSAVRQNTTGRHGTGDKVLVRGWNGTIRDQMKPLESDLQADARQVEPADADEQKVDGWLLRGWGARPSRSIWLCV
jgi:hypothetical protein